MEQYIIDPKKQASNHPTVRSSTSKQSIILSMSPSMELSEDPSSEAPTSVPHPHTNYSSMMDSSWVYYYNNYYSELEISPKEEHALCALLNISPSQKSFLTLTCDASASFGSKFSKYPCLPF